MKHLPVFKRPYFARRILDIGAGHNPFKDATHVLDMDIKEGRERGGNRIVIPSTARLIKGEAEALPFRPEAFDFVYASHVLEHVDDPSRACRELMRVGRAGYIETPSPFLEQGLGLAQHEASQHSFHKWLVFSPEACTLAFEPKTPVTLGEFCTCPDGQFLKEFYRAVDFGEAQHCFRRSAKTTVCYWTDRFVVEVRKGTVDCVRDGRPCRFRGMREALVANCNDLVRAWRVLRLRRRFPACRQIFRNYGHYTVLV